MNQISSENMNCFLVLCLLLSRVSADYVESRATYYSSHDGEGTPTGACGYGEHGRHVYGGKATGVSNLWRNGTGCGACYQVWCTKPALCNEYGTTVVVTDYGQGDRTDFIMSKVGYATMGRETEEKPLLELGVVDVVFSRVPCYYACNNILIRIHEYSRYPDYLAVTVLYVGGINDILAIELKQGWRRWVRMRHAYGAVYDMANPPKAAVAMRFLVRSRNGATRWAYPKRSIPSDWHAGATYDSHIQFY